MEKTMFGYGTQVVEDRTKKPVEQTPRGDWSTTAERPINRTPDMMRDYTLPQPTVALPPTVAELAERYRITLTRYVDLYEHMTEKVTVKVASVTIGEIEAVRKRQREDGLQLRQALPSLLQGRGEVLDAMVSVLRAKAADTAKEFEKIREETQAKMIESGMTIAQASRESLQAQPYVEATGKHRALLSEGDHKNRDVQHCNANEEVSTYHDFCT